MYSFHWLYEITHYSNVLKISKTQPEEDLSTKADQFQGPCTLGSRKKCQNCGQKKNTPMEHIVNAFKCFPPKHFKNVHFIMIDAPKLCILAYLGVSSVFFFLLSEAPLKNAIVVGFCFELKTLKCVWTHRLKWRCLFRLKEKMTNACLSSIFMPSVHEALNFFKSKCPAREQMPQNTYLQFTSQERLLFCSILLLAPRP